MLLFSLSLSLSLHSFAPSLQYLIGVPLRSVPTLFEALQLNVSVSFASSPLCCSHTTRAFLGTEAEQFAREAARRAARERNEGVKQTGWREKSEAFRAAMRAGRT